MNTLLMATLIVLGLGSIFLLWKKDKRLVSIFNVLFATVLMQWAAGLFDANGAIAFHVLTGAVVLGFLIAQFVPKKKVFGAAVSTVLVIVAFLLSGTGEMTLGSGTSQAENKFVLAAIIACSAGPFIIHFVLKIVSKWLPELSPFALASAALPLLAGIGFLFSSLTVPVYGPMLVGATLLIQSFYDNKRSGIISISVYALAAVPLLLVNESIRIALLNADVIAGLLIGVFTVMLIKKTWSGKRNGVLVVIAYALVFGVVFSFAYTGSIFEQMGGLDMFVAILIGAALTQGVKGKNYQGVSLLAPLFALGLMVPSLLVNEELEAAEKDIIKVNTANSTDEGSEEDEPELLPLKELSGKYKIVKESSVIQFELGKEGGRTKGQFKKVSGSFHLPEDLSKAKVKVTLDMSDFTTFNSMRDESLRGDEYFQTDKFPRMTFNGTGFTEKEENVYEVEGTFRMLGVSKPVTVSIQRVKVEGKTVLIGAGSLDRTKFGMTPSAAEGNVVDFNYQVELNQK